MKNPTATVPNKEIVLVLLYIGVQSKPFTKQLKTCINKFYGCFNVRVIFQSAYRIKSFHYTKVGSTIPNCQKLCIRLVVGTARIFILEKQNVDYMTAKLNIVKAITSSCHASAIANHVTSTGHNLKWDHFDIPAKGRQIHIAR